MDTTVLDTLEKKQYVYDTLLVTGWKKDKLCGWLIAQCKDRDIDIMEVHRRCFESGFRNNVPIQAAVFGTCEVMAQHLRNCTCFKDFITVRDNLNIGYYKFKHRVCMIDNNAKRQAKIDATRGKVERAVARGNIADCHKLGGINSSKHNGKGGRAK